jgi:hypothetical protein
MKIEKRILKTQKPLRREKKIKADVGQCYTTFYVQNLQVTSSLSTKVFVPGKSFKPNLMFEIKAGANLRVKHLNGASLR